MQLECFAVGGLTPDIVPGRPQRAWMEQFEDRHAYRCLPLTMANCTGWEILCPMGFTAEWDGGRDQKAITLTPDQPHNQFTDFVRSHFTRGVVTFHTGYLFRTPPGWSMWCSGAPNHVKDGIQALTGLTETDWLPYPFTMNWIFTRPGKVRFEKGEPFCFITLAQDKTLENVEVVLKPLDNDRELAARYTSWVHKRAAFNERLAANEPEAVKAAWQRYYFRGHEPDADGVVQVDHVNKRRLSTPQHRR
jgi:Family of unknown function (DUF6065)